ncbi:MAG: hypothetical protein JNL43_11970 [Flavobacteriales bacterium]|nr:hypothetical protein [Flavobacteriales bacterium]
MISLEAQDIRYTSYHKTKAVVEHIAGHDAELHYTYGPDHQRQQSTCTEGQTQETRLYIGSYEKQAVGGITRELHYVSGGDGLCAILVTEGGTTTYFIFRDHLGSILTVVKTVGSAWTIIAEQNFDAWGRKRNATDWTYANLAPGPRWLYRGFTGHEHVEPFGLINMNGRMYDPVNGRMMSADRYITSPFATQNINRYSYGHNNPLKYTDPDGDLPFLLVPATFLFGSVLDEVFSNGFTWNSIRTGWNSYNRASAGLSSVTSLRVGQIQLGNLSMELRFGLSFGASTGLGFSGTITYSNGNFSASVGASLYGLASSFGPSGMQFAATYGGSIGWNDGSSSIQAYFSSFQSKGTSQRVGGLAMGHKDWSFAIENDFLPGGDGRDRYRTASARISYKQYSTALRLFTGDPELDNYNVKKGGGKDGTYSGPNANAYRAGILSVGDGNVEIGWNAEGIRHLFQNVLIHDYFLDLFDETSPWFERLPDRFPSQGFVQYGPPRPYTLW